MENNNEMIYTTRIHCWYCRKAISSVLSKDVVFRGIAVCPECIEASPENQNHPSLRQDEGEITTPINTIQTALNRFHELVNSLECECDSYNGFTCPLHDDRVLADLAIEEYPYPKSP